MCITSWWYPQDHPTIKFVMIFNRDEALERSTTSAHWWKLENNDEPVMSSTDDRTSVTSTLQLNGNSNSEIITKQYELSSTWLGISKKGKISCLNNLWLKPTVSPIANTFEKVLSRGYLVTNYLTGQETSDQYLKSVLKDSDDYSGFALLAGNIKDKTFSYLQNSTGEGYSKIEPINIQDNEFHILSNLGYPSDTSRAKTLLPQFKNIVKNNTEWELIIQKLLQLLGPQKDSLLRADDHLDGIFVSKHIRKGYPYGTETSTIILVNHSNELKFIERNWYKQNTDDYTKTFEWTI